MLLKIFINYILGYVKVMVEGYYIERFINICTNSDILIWNLRREKNIRLYFNIGINDFKKLGKIAKKTKCRVKIESKQGIPFLLNKYRKRKIFLILLFTVMGAIYISSNYVWNIEIIEKDGAEIENIIQDLQTAGLSIGKPKSKIDKKDVINQIRLNRSDIAWMGIELKGTNAIVKIVKAEETPQIVDENEYCNIVADKDGLITKINSQNGTAKVKEGDVVQKGTILIAGVMEGKYTEPRYVHASGEIQAKVWYTKSKKIEYIQTQKIPTGRKEKKYGIKIKNFQIFLSKSLPKFKLYDTIETENKIKIFSNYYFPISVSVTTFKEYEEEYEEYDLEKAIALGKQEIEQDLDNEVTAQENILRKNCKHLSKRKLCRSICNI